MIQALRQRQRRIIIVLAILLPTIFIAGLWLRKPVPANQSLPLSGKGAPR